MLRADNVMCGISTNGTGAQTLAACPSSIGGLDFYQWLTVTGLNFVNGNSILVSYTIIEYVSLGGAAIQTEKGVGTLTLGASITGCSLVRTNVQSTITGMNTSTPAMTFSGATAINIGTAGNTLIFVGASASEVLAFQPFQDVGSPNGYPPMMTSLPTWNGGTNLVNGQNWYINFIWPSQMLAKRVYVRVESPYSGATANLYARLYDFNSSGKPGKLLYDFGHVGTTNDAFNVSAFTMISSLASGNGFLLMPGEYLLNLAPIWTAGGSGTPSLTQYATGSGPILSGSRGSSGGVGIACISYDNSANATPADPAPAQAGNFGTYPVFFFDKS